MLSRLASYLMRGAASGADDEEGALAAGQAPDEACSENAAVQPVDARLRQVEIEGDDWILIDRNVEGMDESWYVTPPACFTQPGPVHVETSPLEDLLIEHPSMSVYRSAGSKKTGSDKSEKQQRVKRRAPVPEAVKPSSGGSARLPLSARNVNHLNQQQQQAVTVVGGKTTTTTIARPQLVQGDASACRKVSAKANSSNSSAVVVVSNSNRSSHCHTHPVTHHHTNHHHHHSNGAAVVEQAPRRSSLRDLRSARGDENLRIVQFRSAQKMLEKRTSQSAKRNRLERANKVREVASGKSRRPRRQDRLRLNNSGANNNRKC